MPTIPLRAIATTISLVASLAAQAIKIDAEKLEAFTDQLIGGWLERERIPGATFVFVAGGKVVFASGHGLADIERNVPVDPARTLFRVASLSKSVTATAIAQLVERGKIDYRDDVARYLPEMRASTGGHGAMQLHHLLTHTAGFDDRNIGRMVRRLDDMPVRSPFLARPRPRRVYRAGEICSYSNYSYFLLGHVVESVSEMSLQDYFAQHVFAPLGMQRSSFAPGESLAADFALGYELRGDRRVATDHGWDIGGAESSLSTTAVDYAQFLLAHLGDGAVGDARILSPASIETLHGQQFTHHDKLAGSCYGWFERNRRGWRRIEHGGHWTGFSSYAAMVPELGIGAFVSMNAEWAGWPVRAVLHQFFDEILPVRESPQRAAVTKDRAIANGHAFEVAGVYRTTHRARSNIESITSLFGGSAVEAIDAGRIRYAWTEYVEVEPWLFLPADEQQYEVYPRPLAFERLEDGSVRMFADRHSYERVVWYDTQLWQAVFGAVLALVACSSLLVWVVAGLRRRAAQAIVLRARRVAGVLGLIVVIVFAGLGLSVDYAMGSNGGEFAFGVPWWTIVLLTLPLIATALTMWLAIDLARAWRQCSGGLATRLWLTMAMLGSVGFLVWLWHWNLLGYWL